MSSEETGLYIIDDEYRIVSANAVARAAYPSIEIGKVCHRAMMNLDAPCSQCPVRAGVFGPKAYFDPTRNLHVIVDRYTLPVEGHSTCNALAFRFDEPTESERSHSDEYARVTAVLSAIVENLCSACVVNLAEDSYVNLKTNESSTHPSGYSYSRYMQEIFRPMLADESLPLLAFGDPQVLAAKLQDEQNGSYCAEFHLKTGEWWRITWKSFRALSGDADECLMYSEDITEEIEAEKLSIDLEEAHITDRATLLDTLERTRTQLGIVNALSRNYLNVYLINLENDDLEILKLNGYVTSSLEDTDTLQGLKYDPTLSTYIGERVLPSEREALKDMLCLEGLQTALESKDEFVGSYRILDDGEEHWYEYRYMRLEGEETSHLVVAGFQNIDNIIEEQERNRRTLADALRSAESSSRAKTNFLNNMSHDIRTPMNAIVGFTSLAAAHVDNPEQVASYLEKIQTSSHHLLSLINDVLDMSRIESGKMRIEETETDLANVMHDLKIIVQADIAAKQLDFYIDTVDVINEVVVCDKLRLSQIMLNLLSNAVKFTEPGGYVSVRIIQKEGAPEGYADYEFRVKDSGIGMSEEFIAHVFEAFERERTSTASGTQGTGLGMAITKNIVDMMGGTIEVESALGHGTEFTVSLRFKTGKEHEKDNPLPELQGLRALVVDDNLYTCTSVAKMLHQIGMRADWTLYGKEAVHRATFAKEEGDGYYAYIIDWLMPDMNGIECVRRIRSVVGDESPIIILTAYDWSNIEEEALEAGVTAFCSKPLFMSELKELMEAPFRKEEEPSPAVTETPDFTDCHVLLVEDNALNQEIGVEVLQRAGFEVDVASNGKEAVETVESAPTGTFDVILMDVQMPIMDGYEATQCIRFIPDKDKSSIPIIAVTANTFEEDKERAAEAGMNGHIAKPIDIPNLIETLKTLLK